LTTFPTGTVFSEKKLTFPTGTVFSEKKLTFPTGTVFSEKKLKCFSILSADDSNHPVIHYINNMFSFLNNGDIHNTIRTLTGFSGLSRRDADAIKYQALNHSTAMRRNVMEGRPIFTNIRQLEAEIETRDINSITSGHLPSSIGTGRSSALSAALVTSNDIHHDNAVLALIMAKELAFLNRTIQMISLIASRYQEEQEDAQWGARCGSGGSGGSGGDMMSDDNDNDNDNYDDDHAYSNDCDEEPMTPRSGLPHRAGSHESQNDAYTSDKNQLVATFLVGSGRLQQKFDNLCQLAGTNIVLVNAMTTMDRPRSEANFEKQRTAENHVLSDIYLEFEKYDTEHRDPVVWAFLELRDISVSAWRVMSMLAFCNLIRLAEGTDFTTIYSPEDAIFSQGRDYSMPRQEAAVVNWSRRQEPEAAAEQEQQEQEAIEYD
jgi:hypothetical protein